MNDLVQLDVWLLILGLININLLLCWHWQPCSPVNKVIVEVSDKGLRRIQVELKDGTSELKTTPVSDRGLKFSEEDRVDPTSHHPLGHQCWENHQEWSVEEGAEVTTRAGGEYAPLNRWKTETYRSPSQQQRLMFIPAILRSFPQWRYTLVWRSQSWDSCHWTHCDPLSTCTHT